MDTEASSVPNPYAPPVANIDVAEPAPFVSSVLASRWQRLGALLIDGVLGGLTGIPALVSSGTRHVRLGATVGKHPFSPTDFSTWGLISSALFLGYWAMQSSFIARHGQSLGKMAVGARIVRMDGSRASFWEAVILRTWLVIGLPFIPVVGSLVSTIDVLCIFRGDRRCLHDLVAGTTVVRTSLSPDFTPARPLG